MKFALKISILYSNTLIYYQYHLYLNFIVLKYKALADPEGGRLGGTSYPQMGPNSFVSAYVSAKKHPRPRSALPNGSAPPTGNPGSATVKN